jgi:hypothetical protein
MHRSLDMRLKNPLKTKQKEKKRGEETGEKKKGRKLLHNKISTTQ